MSLKTQRYANRLLNLLILSMLTLLSPSVAPTWAQAQNLTPHSSWADIWQRIVRRRDQEKPRTSRGLVCPVVPQFINQRVIWRDRPIFVWKGEVKTVSLYTVANSQQLVWTKDLLGNSNSVVYAEKPLKPGTEYIWEAKRGLEFSQVMFQVLDQPIRDRVTAKLRQLDTKLQQQKATPEARIQQRVQFFLDQNLFLDAIQELFTVPHSSPELKRLQQQIVQLSCPE
jgi:hypothetical protein